MYHPSNQDVRWMSPVQGKSLLVLAKEPYGNLEMYGFILQPGYKPGGYKGLLPIMLDREGLSLRHYIKATKLLNTLVGNKLLFNCC